MPLIDNLLSLYKVDRQVRSLRGRVESAEIYLKVQKKQMGTIEVEQAENAQQQMQRKANIAITETETGSKSAGALRILLILFAVPRWDNFKSLLKLGLL